MKKTPLAFRLQSGKPFAFAGLWEVWFVPDGSEIRSCTLHHHRGECVDRAVSSPDAHHLSVYENIYRMGDVDKGVHAVY